MVSEIEVEFLVNGQPVPVGSANIHSGAYGSCGHLVAETSTVALARAGVDIVSLAARAPAGLPLDVYAVLEGSRSHIFGGEHLTTTFDYDSDLVTIHARDWAGPLVDQKRVLTSVLTQALGAAQSVLAPAQVSGKGVETQNQKLSQVVTAIAEQFSLKPLVTFSVSDDRTIGSLYGSPDSVYWPAPQTLWALLNKLARDTGNDVYVTPGRHLVFGPPGAQLTPIVLSYRLNPAPVGAYPCKRLRIEHNPRRNLSFQVVVLSYDPAKAQETIGTAVVIGTNVATNNTSTVHPGLWVGEQAQAVMSAIGESAGRVAVPLYTIRSDGLTQAQAQAHAQAIASDIAKRELILTAETDGVPLVRPLNPLRLVSDIVAREMTSHRYWVNAYEHVMRMPQPGSMRAEFLTRLVALDLQLQGIGDPVTVGTRAASSPIIAPTAGLSPAGG